MSIVVELKITFVNIFYIPTRMNHIFSASLKIGFSSFFFPEFYTKMNGFLTYTCIESAGVGAILFCVNSREHFM